MVWYNYRRVPAVTLAKQLIDEGRLGRIFHYRAKFLQDWTISQGPAAGRRRRSGGSTSTWPAAASPATCWRTASTPRSGSTAASTDVTAMTETFIKERKHNLTGKVEPVGIDDACAFLARFDNGSLAHLRGDPLRARHKALYTFEINGEHASIAWDLHDLHRLQYFDHRDEGRLRGWRSIHVTDGDHPYMKHWWVPGLQIGYEHTFVHQVADFLAEPGQRQAASRPTFRDALATDYVTDAVLKSAHRSGGRRWPGCSRLSPIVPHASCGITSAATCSIGLWL